MEYINAKGFSIFSSIEPGEGFWVNSDIPQTLTQSGESPTDTSLALDNGWNLIGLKSDQTKPIADLISGNENSIASIWKWTENVWSVYLPGGGTAAYAEAKGFGVLDDVKPGEGFWLNCDVAITLP